MNEIIELEGKYVLQTYIRPPIVFTDGKGLTLVDSEGKEYLDFTSGIAVTALGHSDEEWVTAVSNQAAKLTHVSNLYHTAPQAQLAQRLVENSFADRVYFCNSGAEANEAALKFARKVSYAAGAAGKTKIITFTGGFHGRTMGALSTTYKDKYRAPFAPLVPNVEFATFNDVESATAAIDDTVCAVIVEPVQGEGGVHAADPAFLHALRALCDKHNALLIFDEVQCGLGRTGTLWAHEQTGVTPDMMTLAKPLAGGLPIGATLMTQAVADTIKPGDHGSTFAAGALICTAANVVFDRVNQLDFLAQVRENGTYLRAQLQAIPSEKIVEVRGTGLLAAMEMKTAVAPLISAARQNGLILISAGENTLRFAPALVVTKDDVETAVAILTKLIMEN